MALSLRAGTVTAVTEEGEELVRLEVDGVACVAYPRITGAVEEGDSVLVNVQARALGLGSGGFDVLYANLTRGLGLAPPEGAHVMALPYTPLQAAWTTVEESGPHAASLDGLARCLLRPAQPAGSRGGRYRPREAGGVPPARRRRAARVPLGYGARPEAARVAGGGGRGGAVSRRRRAGDLGCVGDALGEGAGARVRRVRGRAGNRRHGNGVRPRRHGGRRRGERRRGSCGQGDRGRACVPRRPAGPSSGRLAPHACRARALPRAARGRLAPRARRARGTRGSRRGRGGRLARSVRGPHALSHGPRA